MTLARSLRWLVALALVAALGFAAWKATRPVPVRVLVAAAEAGRVESTVANTRAGSVAACRRAKISPPLGGRIEKLAVRKGERVKQGQLLLQLWNDDLSARERVSREQLVSARARVNEACQMAENAAREAARTRDLRKQGFVSEDRLDRAESEARARAAACDSAHAQVKEAEARIRASAADTARDRKSVVEGKSVDNCV